ncbi:hypothetical protein GQ457_01G007840 [Hibiscus cannabinus]
MAEVNTIGRTYHRNLVRLYGFCFEAETKALVYEYMENGSLDKLLFDKKHEIGWDKLHEIAVGAARGLEFRTRKVVEPRHHKNHHVESWRDPRLCCPGDLDACDVYSFGIMLFEVVGRRREDWFPKQVWESFEKGKLEELWDSCEIEEKYRGKAKTMVTVALWCVQYLPEARPSIRNVVKILEGGAEADTPPNPFQHLMSSAIAHSVTAGSGSISTIDYDEYDTTIMSK